MWEVASGKWEVGSGKWEVGRASGKWELGSEKREVGCKMWDVGCGMWDVGCGMCDVRCGIWQVASGEWQVASGEWEVLNHTASRCQSTPAGEDFGCDAGQLTMNWPMCPRTKAATRSITGRKKRGASSIGPAVWAVAAQRNTSVSDLVSRPRNRLRSATSSCSAEMSRALLYTRIGCFPYMVRLSCVVLNVYEACWEK